MFSIFPVFFFIIFFLIFGTIIFGLFNGVKQWNSNNKQPRLSVSAIIIDKRMDISHHHHTNDNNMTSSSTSTSYYVTFQFESGDRMEFPIDGNEYGLLVHGDKGILKFQGTRYLGFTRTI